MHWERVASIFCPVCESGRDPQLPGRIPNIRIHIVGLAKKAGDVMSAAQEVAMFFFLTLALLPYCC